MAVDTSALTQAVTDAEGTTASVVAFVQNHDAAIATAVAAALSADDAADQGSIDAANAAIAAETARVIGIKTQLAAAIVTNPTPTDPVPTPTPDPAAEPNLSASSRRNR